MNPEVMVPPYLAEVAAILQQQEAAMWDWRRQYRQGSEALDVARLELRKTTYPLEQTSHRTLYDIAAEVAEQLDVSQRPTLYQAQEDASLNAALAPLTDGPHIILYGAVSEQLDDDELRALLGHELSHFVLWQMANGTYMVGDDVLHTLCLQPNPQDAHVRSLRLYRLYTEVFCDRGALAVVGDAEKVMSTLLKTTAGMHDVQASALLEQAKRVLSGETDSTQSSSQSETDLRAMAVHMWSTQEEAVDPQITHIIEGKTPLSELDLLSQQRLQTQTRQVMDRFMEHPGVRTERLFALCRDYFPDYEVREHEPSEPVTSLAEEHESVQQYFVYVLLDLATADPELDELPLAVALQVTKQLEMHARFSEAAIKEMRLRKRQLQQINEQIDTLLGK